MCVNTYRLRGENRSQIVSRLGSLVLFLDYLCSLRSSRSNNMFL